MNCAICFGDCASARDGRESDVCCLCLSRFPGLFETRMDEDRLCSVCDERLKEINRKISEAVG